MHEICGYDVITTNHVRYADHYVKLDGHWLIKRRRTCFLISEKRAFVAWESESGSTGGLSHHLVARARSCSPVYPYAVAQGRPKEGAP